MGEGAGRLKVPEVPWLILNFPYIVIFQKSIKEHLDDISRATIPV